MHNESHFISNLHSSSKPRPSRVRRGPEPIYCRVQYDLRARPSDVPRRARSASNTAPRQSPKRARDAPETIGQHAIARHPNRSGTVTDTPTSEPRPPLYPAEWVAEPSCSVTLTWSPDPSEPASVPVRQNPTAVIQSATKERQEPRSRKREHQD